MKSILNTAWALEFPDAAKAFNTLNLNSPAAFATLAGIGPGGSVTQGLFLYIKVQARMTIRITQKGTTLLDPPIVNSFPIQGAMVIPFPLENTLQLIEAQGVGAVEYLVGGNL